MIIAELCFMQIKSPSPSHPPNGSVSPEKPQSPIEMHTWAATKNQVGVYLKRDPIFFVEMNQTSMSQATKFFGKIDQAEDNF